MKSVQVGLAALAFGAWPTFSLAQADPEFSPRYLSDLVGVSCSIGIDEPIEVLDGPDGDLQFTLPADSYLTIRGWGIIDDVPWVRVSDDRAADPTRVIGWVYAPDLACI